MRRARGFTLVELLVALFALAIMAALSWRGLDGMVRARHMTEARADEVLTLQTGLAQWAADLEAIGPLGRVIVVGTGAGAETSINLRSLMGKRASLMGTVLRARPHEQKAAAVQAFARSVVPLLASGAVRPIVDRVFPAGEAPAAFDRLAGRGKFGKVLLEFEI